MRRLRSTHGRSTMSSMAENLPTRHRLTVGDYYRMGEAGILSPDARVELIEGEIIDMAPIGSRHAGTVERIAAALRQAIGARAMVRTQQPVSLDERSEPEPDVTVVRPRDDYYTSAHPRPDDVLLIVEVAEASLAYDREIKVPLYARHGIGEAWIVDLVAGRVVRCSRPRDNAYTQTETLKLDRPIELDALDGVEVELSALFRS